MDDRLTYKIGEVCGEQATRLYICFFNDSIEKISEAFEALGKQIGEILAMSLEDVLGSLWNFFEVSEKSFEEELKRNNLRPIKSIKPTHKAPIYRIIPYVRNRC